MAIDFRRGNMSKSALILLIQENPADGQPVRQALANGGDGSRVQLVTRVGTALARLAGGGVDLVILDLSRSDKLEIEDRDRFLKLRSLAPTVPFVVVHDSEDDSLIVRTVKAGGGDCLSRARCDAALSLMARSAIENRLTQPIMSPEPRKEGTIVTVLGAKGGVGATTVALNVASALTQWGRVILTELRPAFGTLTPYFHPQGLAGNIAHLLRADGAMIEPAQVRALLWPYQKIPGLTILFGPQVMEECGEVTAHSVQALLNALSTAADYVVVDLPAALSEANRAALQESGCLLLAVEPDPLCVETAKQILHTTRTWNDMPRLTGSVIVNRSPIAFPMDPSNIEKELAIPTLGVIPLATDVCAAAQKAATPLTLFAPDSEAARSLNSLAEAFAPHRRRLATPSSLLPATCQAI